jgi:hypothetical protein
MGKRRRKKNELPLYVEPTPEVLNYSYRWRFEVKVSQIPDSGNGVYSLQFIPKETIIGFYSGNVRNREQIPLYPGYLLEVTPLIYIDGGFSPRNITAMINDAHRSPYHNNCDFHYFGNDEQFNKDCDENVIDGEIQVVPLIGIKTIRDIGNGEELFLCYGTDYW